MQVENDIGRYPDSLGDRIRALLRAAGISQKQLAEVTGIPRSTLNEIIKGKKEPAIGRVARIANALGADIHWLISGEAYPPGGQSPTLVAEPSEAYHQQPLAALLKLYSRLSEDKRKALLQYARGLAGEHDA